MSSNTKYLTATLFENVYNLFGVEDDASLIIRMTQIGIIYTVLVGSYQLFKPAPYGRHSSSGGYSWIYGPLVNAKLSWLVQECPAFIVPSILMVQSKCVHFNNYPNLILVGLFMAHYVQRSVIYPFRMNQQSNPVPLMVTLNAFIFCLFNGLFQSHHLLNIHFVNRSSPFFSAGLILFVIGMTINIYHDGILISLRQANDEQKTKYKIPRGFLFEYISGANYAGEILEWWGFAIASGGIPQLLFAIFSTVFLGSRALHHHRFYHKTFGNLYPASRKAFIPFIL